MTIQQNKRLNIADQEIHEVENDLNESSSEHNKEEQ